MVMGMTGQKQGLDLRGTKVEVATTMAETSPRRLGELALTFIFPRKFSEAQLAELRKAVDLCPVRNSLRPEVAVKVLLVSP